MVSIRLAKKKKKRMVSIIKNYLNQSTSDSKKG